MASYASGGCRAFAIHVNLRLHTGLSELLVLIDNAVVKRVFSARRDLHRALRPYGLELAELDYFTALVFVPHVFWNFLGSVSFLTSICLL